MKPAKVVELIYILNEISVCIDKDVKEKIEPKLVKAKSILDNESKYHKDCELEYSRGFRDGFKAGTDLTVDEFLNEVLSIPSSVSESERKHYLKMIANKIKGEQKR